MDPAFGAEDKYVAKSRTETDLLDQVNPTRRERASRRHMDNMLVGHAFRKHAKRLCTYFERARVPWHNLPTSQCKPTSMQPSLQTKQAKRHTHTQACRYPFDSLYGDVFLKVVPSSPVFLFVSL